MVLEQQRQSELIQSGQVTFNAETEGKQYDEAEPLSPFSSMLYQQGFRFAQSEETETWLRVEEQKKLA